EVGAESLSLLLGRVPLALGHGLRLLSGVGGVLERPEVAAELVALAAHLRGLGRQLGIAAPQAGEVLLTTAQRPQPRDDALVSGAVLLEFAELAMQLALPRLATTSLPAPALKPPVGAAQLGPGIDGLVPQLRLGRAVNVVHVIHYHPPVRRHPRRSVPSRSP